MITSAMSHSFRSTRQSARKFGLRLRRDEDGATAVEFALIAVPFFMLLLGAMGICMLFFWMFTTENGVWSAVRDLRTGAFQTGTASDGTGQSTDYAKCPTSDPLKTECFIKTLRTRICVLTPNPTDCLANSIVDVRADSPSAPIAEPSCTDAANALKAQTDAVFSPGTKSQVVLVTFCYAWKFASQLPFLPISKLSNGAYLIQASAVFETEPY
jgi:Flp pilus assembly pilin Flp